ncbi:hypothetical protein C8R47DRAFT_1079880 [Mycena vitilis]|nr:hypothetical protein C8R47DRAFT_1079880 [Mycena vitilis]
MSPFWVSHLLPLVSALTVPIPLSAGDPLPPPPPPSVDGNLVSLSIEQDRWLDWVGNTSRNSFFFNTLDNLVALTGSDPTIRIGPPSRMNQVVNKRSHGQEGILKTIRTTAQLYSPRSRRFLRQPRSSLTRRQQISSQVPGLMRQAAMFLPTGTGVTFKHSQKLQIQATFLETQAIINAFSSSDFKNAGITLDFLEYADTKAAELFLYSVVQILIPITNKLKAQSRPDASYEIGERHALTVRELTDGIELDISDDYTACAQTSVYGKAFFS